jgi:hypothetical protein
VDDEALPECPTFITNDLKIQVKNAVVTERTDAHQFLFFAADIASEQLDNNKICS